MKKVQIAMLALIILFSISCESKKTIQKQSEYANNKSDKIVKKRTHLHSGLTYSLKYPDQKIKSIEYGRSFPQLITISYDEKYLGVIHSHFEIFNAKNMNSIKIIKPVENVNIDNAPFYINAIFSDKLYLLKSNGDIDVFALHSWKKLDTFKLNINPSKQFAINVNNGILAIADKDHFIHIYDTKTRTTLKKIPMKNYLDENEIISITYSDSEKSYIIALNTTSIYHLNKNYSVVYKGKLDNEKEYSRYAYAQVFKNFIFIGDYNNSASYNLETSGKKKFEIEGINSGLNMFAIGKNHIYSKVYSHGILKIDRFSNKIIKEYDLFNLAFQDVFFKDEVNLPKHADMIILYDKGYEYFNIKESRFFSRHTIKTGFNNAIIDKNKNLLLIGTEGSNIKIWNPLTHTHKYTFTNVLVEKQVISIGYNSETQHCAILYGDFSLDIFSKKGKKVFNYVSAVKEEDEYSRGFYQNIYFRDAQTLYFFDKNTLIKINLAKKTFEKKYIVDLEIHATYYYHFNPENGTVNMHSEYCSGCRIGGKILVIDLDTMNILNKISTRNYGQTFTFCKYYTHKFITASSMLEEFRLNEIVN